MITDHIDGVVSLIQTNNAAMINGFTESGFITTDHIHTALNKMGSLYSTDMNFLVMLIDKLEFVDDIALVNRCLRTFSASNHAEYDWNEKTSQLFAKLVEWGGKLAWYDVIYLPYDAFMYYFERDDEIIWDDIIGIVTYDSIDSRIINMLNKKLEPEISTIKCTDFVEYVSALIEKDMCPDFMVQEIYNRRLFDRVYVYLLRTKSSAVFAPFFDRYINECEHVDEYKFIRACIGADKQNTNHFTVADAYSRYNDEDSIDTTKLSQLLKDNARIRILYHTIMCTDYSASYAQIVVPNIRTLMQIFADA